MESVEYRTKNENLRKRMKVFSLDTIRFLNKVSTNDVSRVIKNQLLRSATSVAANYISACRSRSTPEFISKMGIVAEEADESLYWMEILEETQYIDKEWLNYLKREINEILAIVVTSIKTAKKQI